MRDHSVKTKSYTAANSFMQWLKQDVVLRNLVYALLLFLFLLITVAPFQLDASEGEIKLRVFKLQPVPGKLHTFKVQADVDYQLNDYLHHALLNGVILKSSFTFDYGKNRSWLWDKKITLSVLRFQLKYHALSEHYLLTQNDTNEHWNFSNLPAALRKMGEIRNYQLPQLPRNNQSEDDYIVANVEIGPSQINLPLRIQSWLGDKYSLRSEDIRWPLR